MVRFSPSELMCFQKVLILSAKNRCLGGNSSNASLLTKEIDAVLISSHSIYCTIFHGNGTENSSSVNSTLLIFLYSIRYYTVPKIHGQNFLCSVDVVLRYCRKHT